MSSHIIHFIRHGMTEANLTGGYAGARDIPVCPEGEAKLRSLKDNYGYPQAEEFYSSPLIRCVQTCGLIYPHAIPVITDALRECSFEDWDAKTAKKFLYDKIYAKRLESDRREAPSGGESGSSFHKRTCHAFERLADSLIERGINSSVMFTHGGVIMLILSTYGLPKTDFHEWLADNGCGFSVRITPDLWMRDKVFEVYEKIPLGACAEAKGEFKNLIDSLNSKK